ncbi:CHAT domain-containing protein [Azotobacter beijerinckii]|uniref:Lecithin:cholesterol acyltransferase n=1 Tax=Azotobacter beijerinckii TaxID=170623 RepID=A0A1I4D3R8_9GAMM|nr:CHAT domain-containing protein [Azotobacter beijerinckii]SFK86691.1 Lecithin:cholesterol acyltransferase [Azotobacter beijerinckii]
MGERSFRIRGRLADAASPRLGGDTTHLGATRRLVPGRARDGVTDELEVSAGEVVRIELDNGFVLWSRADDLVHEHGRRGLSRDGGEAWEFDRLAPRRDGASRDERGLLGLGVKLLDFFGIELDKVAARELGSRLEDKQLKARPPGLYRCSLDDAFQLTPANPVAPADPGPLLVFIHGTASSGQGSFGKLWEPDNAAGRTARQQLKTRYAERVFAFEHRSLSESPIVNALALADSLPAGAELHLVTHSRGGLIGELLCLGECENLTQVLTPERLKELFAADRTIAEQLGLSPLDTQALKARDDAYAQDRDALAELIGIFAAKHFRVTRFVRVACPARGTTLASGRLDRWLSMLDFLAGKMLGESLFADGLDFLLAVVKERTDPRTLPGLEAMMPGSALTRLLHHPELLTPADLSVIAGDIEGDSLWQKLKLLASDWFYGADHDLVVNTGSMSGGLRRSGQGARFHEDKGSEVNHFGYFRNARSVNWLLAGLTRLDGEDGGFLPIAAAQHTPPRWRGAVERSLGDTRPRPLAVVLPGILGSHLKAAGKHVWLNYWALLRGGLQDIALDAPDVTADTPIDEFYGPLLEFLAHTHRVRVFAYDWRLSIREAAAKLATALEIWLLQAERDRQPVHLVAHSLGGLVVRAMMADGGPGAALWQRIARLPNSRLLMLGTPNFGTYEAVRWLTGCNPTQARLSLLDFTRDTGEIVNLVREYPGLLELLPCAPGEPDFADPALWQKIQAQLKAPWKIAESAALVHARNTWSLLRAAKPDPERMRYVAGCQPATVIAHQFGADDSPGPDGRKHLDFLATREGDGTVTWASGNLPGVKMWYVEDTAHDALCVQRHAFPAYLDLLQTGTTTRLPDTPPARPRTAADEPERFILPASPPTDGIPPESALCGFGFGGGLPETAFDERPALPTIEVSIRHGDLSYARHPVMVGHYHGDTIISAERTLDRQLDGALSRRQQLGLYPGRLGSHALFFNEHANAKPAGAIVVGLGQVGELSPSLLEAGVRAAVLDYALQVAQWPDERFGPQGSPRHASLSCLLVGTGAGGVTVRDSLEAILRGAIAANARLADTGLDSRATLDRLEFLDVYEDMAIAAAEALRQILGVAELASTLRWPAQEVESGPAGQRRVLFDDEPEWWHRLEIVEEDSHRDSLRFIFSTDRARAEETLATGQLALAESFIRQASNSARANPETARTLFEMLLPLHLREVAPRQSGLVVLVDQRSARYPWELLENRWGDGERPRAVRSGLIRQLKTREFRPRPAYAFQAQALVVGNPDLDGWDKFADLPGARREAQQVATLLAGHDWQVRDCIDEKTDAIIENLHRDTWRILHLAGHGVHEYSLPSLKDNDQPRDACTCSTPAPATKRLSGMVIGRETLLTPGDIEQMRWVPELVFINCCHLGNTQASESSVRGELAANLGVQFIRMGVRAVVAAGWAVDDGAALAFAETFYTQLLDGQPFGEAVRAAREDIWLRFPGVNTWGAYQCYGDPNYRLYHNGETRIHRPAPYNAPAELAADLDNLAQTLKASGDTEDPEQIPAQRINALLERVPEPQRERWQQRAEVAAALGFAWGEARNWPAAIECLEKALCAAAGDCPIRVVEQLANFRVRRAAEDWLALRRQGGSETDRERQTRSETLAQATADLEHLCQRAPTAERLNLLGSACKRLALMREQPSERLATLARMAEAYWQAFECGGRSEAYPFGNWASARLLALRLGASRTGDWQRTLEAECTRLCEALQRNDRRDPDFWDNAGPAGLDLVLLLARHLSPPPSATTPPPDDEALVARIIDGYRSAIKRGASPRQRASAVENLDWLIALLVADQPALAAALVRIREAIR